MRDRRALIEAALAAVSMLAAAAVAGVTLFILGLVAIKGMEHLSWEFLSTPPAGDMASGGILPMINGTVMLVLLMSLFTAPLGGLIALYLNEVSPRDWLYHAIISSVRSLAAIPSIVYGLFGLTFYVTVIGGGLDALFGFTDRVFQERCLLWAALTMGTLTLPTNIVAVTEALELVPASQRHAALCLGYTRWETIKWVVAPQAAGGMLTGLALSISRGAGEVAPILFVGVAYYMPGFTGDPLGQFMELGYHIFVMATQSSNVERTLPIQYATTLTLLTITFALNAVGQYIRWRCRQKLAPR